MTDTEAGKPAPTTESEKVYRRLLVGDILQRFARADLEAYLIGSVRERGESHHDFDVLVLGEFSEYPYAKLRGILSPKVKPIVTDWDGLFYPKTFFGPVDVFFLNRLMKLAEKDLDSLASESEREHDFRLLHCLDNGNKCDHYLDAGDIAEAIIDAKKRGLSGVGKVGRRVYIADFIEVPELSVIEPKAGGTGKEGE